MQYLITNKTSRFLLFFSAFFLISCSSQQLRPVEKTKFTETVVSSSNDVSISVSNIDTTPIKRDAVNEGQALWQRLFALYQFPTVDNKRIQAEINWYSKHPEYMARVQKNAAPYLFYIVNEVQQRGLPGELALLPIVESAFRPFAYSHGRAAGLWQFIPSTGKAFGLKQTWWYDGRRDVTASTDAALTYLTKLSSRFDDWFLGLAAYNAGGGNISKAIKYNKKRGKNTDYWALKLRRETLQYVPKLIAISHILAHADQYNIALLPIPNKPYFQKINTKKQIDLARASALANIDITELYSLNPAFNQWATDPAGPHYLLLPAEKADDFKLLLTNLPDNQRLKWKRHKIKQGETLGHISNKYHTPIALIKQANQIRNHSIRAGKYLLIPTPSFDDELYTRSSPMRKKAIVSAKRKGQKLQYRVRKGDSLWTISQHHKVTVRQLAKWNAMAPGDTLKVGQQLSIWQRSSSRSLPISPASKHQAISYRVRSGDSLYLISKKFKVSINDLKRWNTLNKKYLKPGQRLKIIVDVTRT